ncbi:MAG TPA: hypothetical protein VEO01_02220 [Pseudonocardiaceae bacterium]|nr:hypothetical protein [Pseudonocardiaceae bacterium]
MRSPRPPRSNLTGLVGWIFADTLLVLVVIFLATQTGGAVSQPLPRPTTPRPTPTPTTTVTAPPGVDSNYVCFPILTDPSLSSDVALQAIENQVANRLAQPDLTGRRAGVVLTFGVANDPGTGITRATTFNADILPQLGSFFQRGDGSVVASRAFWGGNPKQGEPDGTIVMDIYPLVGDGFGPLTGPSADC